MAIRLDITTNFHVENMHPSKIKNDVGKATEGKPKKATQELAVNLKSLAEKAAKQNLEQKANNLNAPTTKSPIDYSANQVGYSASDVKSATNKNESEKHDAPLDKVQKLKLSHQEDALNLERMQSKLHKKSSGDPSAAASKKVKAATAKFPLTEPHLPKPNTKLFAEKSTMDYHVPVKEILRGREEENLNLTEKSKVQGRKENELASENHEDEAIDQNDNSRRRRSDIVHGSSKGNDNRRSERAKTVTRAVDEEKNRHEGVEADLTKVVATHKKLIETAEEAQMTLEDSLDRLMNLDATAKVTTRTKSAPGKSEDVKDDLAYEGYQENQHVFEQPSAADNSGAEPTAGSSSSAMHSTLVYNYAIILKSALNSTDGKLEDGQDVPPAADQAIGRLQSEGVFGVSQSGRNLTLSDFIKQKQFEYQLDQRSFSPDNFLHEVENAICNVLNTGQATVTGKALTQSAEAVNNYRNALLRQQEEGEELPHIHPERQHQVTAPPREKPRT